jgi:monothiol glutaredoxin
MTPEVQTQIQELVNKNKIVVFMKGSKLMPQCGFSNNTVQILNSLGAPYETVDVLQDPDIRQGIKEYSNWPTIPQVYINGEFVGGSDVLIELYQQGELQQMIEVALAS